MNKAIAIILAAMLLLAAAACDNNTAPSSEASSRTSSAPASSTASEPPAPESSQTESGNAVGVLAGVNQENYPQIDGSTANMPLLAEMYSKICGVSYETAESMVRVSGGTGAVWQNMMYHGTGLILAYEAPEVIKAGLKQEGVWDNLEITPVGSDGLVFLVNKQNPVDGLTTQQLIDIYTGKITNWSEVGGNDEPIAAFQRNIESGSQTLFLRLLMGDITPMDPETELRPYGMGALIDAVAEYDGSGGAIGFSVYYYANLMNENPNLKLLAIDGIEPTAESIADKRYPLVNDFYVVIRKDEPQDSPARLVHDWILSDEGKQLMTDANYVPVK